MVSCFRIRCVEFKSILPVVAVVFAVGLIGYYALYLNSLYYSKYGPFYDSMSYMNQLAIVMSNARNDGFLAALLPSLKGSTVFIPWLEASILGCFISPERGIEVFIQIPLVMAQALSGYVYFKKVPRYSSLVSSIFSIILISFEAVFFYNGGLSDLRMDLSQALAFGAALAFFCVAHASREFKYWILFGLMLGVSFLFRATTPVYAILVFGLCCLIDMIKSKGDVRYALYPYLISAIVAGAASIWFFVLNFRDLYFYYFIWNYDANAALPMAQSIGHFYFLFMRHIGWPILIFSAAVFAVELIQRLREKENNSSVINFCALVGGLGPVMFLVLFGAALNPFVSMASVPGTLMFWLSPFVARSSIAGNSRKNIFYVTGAFLAIAFSAMQGIESHTKIASPWVSNIESVKKIAVDMVSDMKERGKEVAAFEVTYVGSLDSMALINSFIYDQKFSLDQKFNANKGTITVSAIQPGLANPVDWRAIKGDTDEDKIRTLVDDAVKSADYLIVPEEGTTFVPHHPISPYAIRFRELLLATNSFSKVSGPIQVSSLESVSVYRNVSR